MADFDGKTNVYLAARVQPINTGLHTKKGAPIAGKSITVTSGVVSDSAVTEGPSKYVSYAGQKILQDLTTGEIDPKKYSNPNDPINKQLNTDIGSLTVCTTEHVFPKGTKDVLVVAHAKDDSDLYKKGNVARVKATVEHSLYPSGMKFPTSSCKEIPYKGPKLGK